MNNSNEYPKTWWAPFPEEKAYEWEILPQAAKTGEVILSKRNELGLLSNFADTPFDLDGIRYASLEGFWQMMKFPESSEDERCQRTDIQWPFRREEVANMLGFDAVAAGDQADVLMEELGIDWVTYQGQKMKIWTMERGPHFELILRATKAKLAQNPRVVEVLRSTGDLILKPDHHQPDNAPPAWKYFDIYMELRDSLEG